MLSLLALLVASACAFAADVGSTPVALNFEGSHVSQVVELYRDMSSSELVVDSRVGAVPHLITLQARSASKEEALKLIRKALLEQAGIVIAPLGEKRASVTYNDALPIAKKTKDD